MYGTSGKPFILVIEADADQAQAIIATLNETVQYDIQVLHDGTQALDYLHSQGEYTMAQRPDLILLDPNLPQKNGQDILSEIKNTPTLKRIPVIILTATTNAEAIFRAYQQQGNCYVIKPDDRHNLTQTIQRIKEFWLGIATLPS